MNSFFIVTNKTKDPDYSFTLQIKEIIEKAGRSCCGFTGTLPCDNDEKSRDFPRQIPETADCVIVLGGDGTILRTARNLYKKNIPILGINLGHVGYLTEGSRGSAAELLNKVFADEYIIENRMLIEGAAIGETPMVALNDITINRCNSLKIIEFNLYVNGELLYNYRADGIIVATPTGSTAYNLSCGGPVAVPTSRMIIITPIAPHSLNNRSLLLSAEDKIEIEIIGSDKDLDNQVQYIAYFDGDSKRTLAPGMRLCINSIQDEVKLVRLSKQSFLQTLKYKMS